MQYIDLYLESAEEVISNCPGVIYLEGIINMERGYQIPVKNPENLWKSIKCSNDELFCYVSNDQVHILDITLNENNSNVRILNENLEDLRVKGLKDIIVENIRQRVLHHEEKWGKIIDYGGVYMNLRDREQVPSKLAGLSIIVDIEELTKAMPVQKLGLLLKSNKFER